MERSHIGLHIWLKAMYLLSASKKGMSTHQLHRMLGVSLKSTWFLMHRIREAMREPYFAKMGGRGSSVQADETFIGRTTTRAGERRQRGYQEKEPMVTLVDGDKATRKVRSFHVPEVNAATLRPILKEQIDAASWLMTDDARYYQPIGTDYRRHFVVNHSIGEYVSGGTNHQCRRKLFLDPEAQHQWRLPARLTHAFEAVCWRVRFPLQQPHRARRQRYRADQESCCGGGG
jgi:transposase-like protein